MIRSHSWGRPGSGTISSRGICLGPSAQILEHAPRPPGWRGRGVRTSGGLARNLHRLIELDHEGSVLRQARLLSLLAHDDRGPRGAADDRADHGALGPLAEDAAEDRAADRRSADDLGVVPLLARTDL